MKKIYNKTLLDSLAKFPESVKDKSPLFIYAHLGMPHFPYFYDSVGKAYPNEVIFNDSMITDKNKFANYIVYTNHKLEELVSGLLKKTEGKAVIIIQSDHGVGDFDWSRKKDGFRNISAFYFPDKDYHLLYPKMSNVNTFRILLNKYMGQQLPLLKDSTIFLID